MYQISIHLEISFEDRDENKKQDVSFELPKQKLLEIQKYFVTRTHTGSTARLVSCSQYNNVRLDV